MTTNNSEMAGSDVVRRISAVVASFSYFLSLPGNLAVKVTRLRNSPRFTARRRSNGGN